MVLERAAVLVLALGVVAALLWAAAVAAVALSAEASGVALVVALAPDLEPVLELVSERVRVRVWAWARVMTSGRVGMNGFLNLDCDA